MVKFPVNRIFNAWHVPCKHDLRGKGGATLKTHGLKFPSGSTFFACLIVSFFLCFFLFLVGQYDHRQGLKHQAVRNIDFNFFANGQHTTKEGLQERNIRDCIFEGWFTKTGCGSNRAVNRSIMDTSNSHRRFPSSTDNSAFGTTTLRP